MEERTARGKGPGPVGIALVGLGGTGSALLPLLMRMGFERITLIDGDTVEERNLPRQLLYTSEDVGMAKVDAAAGRLKEHCATTLLPEFRFIDATNCAELLGGHAVIADCTDDLLARNMLDRTCADLQLPLVSGAVHGMQMQVTTRHGAGCLSRTAFFPGRPAEEQEGCDMQAVPPAVTTITAALMALRIQDLLNGGHGHAGIMDLVDVEQGRWMRIMGPGSGDLMDTPVRRADHA